MPEIVVATVRAALTAVAREAAEVGSVVSAWSDWVKVFITPSRALPLPGLP